MVSSKRYEIGHVIRKFKLLKCIKLNRSSINENHTIKIKMDSFSNKIVNESHEEKRMKGTETIFKDKNGQN